MGKIHKFLPSEVVKIENPPPFNVHYYDYHINVDSSGWEIAHTSSWSHKDQERANEKKDESIADALLDTD